MDSDWMHEDSIDIAAAPERVWRLFADAPGWPRWNAGVAAIALHGAFADGARFDMQLPDGTVLESVLRDVVPGEGFGDETLLGPARVRVRVDHRIAPRLGGCRVRYRTEVRGGPAADIGDAVAGDFPQVLIALRALAEAG